MYTLSEVETLTNGKLKKKALAKRCERGAIPHFKNNKGQLCITDEVYHSLIGDIACYSNFDSMVNKWVHEMEIGLNTVTKTPLTPNHIDNLRRGLNNYFKYSKQDKAIQNITPDGLITAYIAIGYNHEEQKDFYSKKLYLFKGVKSFCKMLVRLELMQREQLYAINETKPGSMYEARQTVLSDDDFQRLLEANKARTKGRSDYDINITHLMMMLMFWGAMRSAEVVGLTWSNIDMQTREIRFLGKGRRWREIAMNDGLYNQMKHVEKYYKVDTKKVFMANPKSLYKRVTLIAKAAGVDVTPHGFRRGGLTMYESKGYTDAELMLISGHKKRETLQKYIHPERRKVLEKMKQL